MRFSIVLIATGLVSAAVIQSSPTWFTTTGGRQQTAKEALRDSNDRRLNLDEEGETIRQRSALTEDVAARLCDGQLTLPEAVDAIEPLARAAPEWFHSVRLSYQGFSQVSPTATEREVITTYLLHKIEQRADQARERGDTSRATTISARRVELERRAEPSQPFPTRIQVGTH